jgi:hypothetical protein
LKLIFDHQKTNPKRPNVYAKLKGKKPKFLFEKEEGHAVRRRSRYTFLYKDQIYDLKRNTIKCVV